VNLQFCLDWDECANVYLNASASVAGFEMILHRHVSHYLITYYLPSGTSFLLTYPQVLHQLVSTFRYLIAFYILPGASSLTVHTTYTQTAHNIPPTLSYLINYYSSLDTSSLADYPQVLRSPTGSSQPTLLCRHLLQPSSCLFTLWAGGVIPLACCC
jgi:hypothetical protein